MTGPASRREGLLRSATSLTPRTGDAEEQLRAKGRTPRRGDAQSGWRNRGAGGPVARVVCATNIAAHIGQGMAWVFGFIGLFTNPFLIFIALFVWMGAAQEAGLVQMKSALGGIPVGRVMITNFRVLAPDEPLAVAVEHILSGCQQDFPVVEDGRVVGVLTRSDLLNGLAQRGQTAPVGEVMQRQFQTTDPAEMIEHVLARLQEDDCRTMPVMGNGQLAGILTMENLGEFLMVQAALHGDRPRHRRSVVPVAEQRHV